MTKHERLKAETGVAEHSGNPLACYERFFELFNEGEYFQAHDVLEHLWLQTKDSNALFFKGLIQIAGAFVHLRKNFLRPEHPKDATRLRPAARLLALAVKNLSPYGSCHLGLDVRNLCLFCDDMARKIAESGYQANPWSPENLPAMSIDTRVLPRKEP